MRKWLWLLLAVAALASQARAKCVVVIPIHDEINEPELYLLRRGLKLAAARRADAVVLDLRTPGGAIDVTFDMMDALAKFHGRTFAFVDNEAASAGSFIAAATDEIWFAPDGVIGAAAPVAGAGQDLGATMKQKLVSYLKARIRSVSADKGYRGEVISAMIDADDELVIDGKVLKPKGQLLSLTATEAMRAYGRPPQPLLGSGIAPNIGALLADKFGAGEDYATIFLTETWSERMAVWLNRLSPVLIGLGLFAIFLQFKMGFHGFGLAGGVLLAAVFFGSHAAGLSGHEPAILFVVGAILLALEMAFFHTAGLLAAGGLSLMAGAIVWSMADLWPGEPVSAAWSAGAFLHPAFNFGLGLGLAVVLAVVLGRFLPDGWIWDRLMLRATVGAAAQSAGAGPEAAAALASLVGRRATAVTALRPGGQVEIDGRRYEAQIALGTVDAGAPVTVRGRADFCLIVERAES